MLDLAKYPEEGLSAPLNTKKHEPVTERWTETKIQTEWENSCQQWIKQTLCDGQTAPSSGHSRQKQIYISVSCYQIKSCKRHNRLWIYKHNLALYKLTVAD